MYPRPPFIKEFPRPFLQLKPIRAAARKSMTIGIGFTTGDAVILCAETQETVSDYTKTTTQKIRVTTFFNNWRLAISGSSDASQYIELFEHEVWNALCNAGTDFNYARSVNIIKATLHKIHKQYIWLRHGSEGRPSLQFLIAIQGINPNPSRSLLFSQDGALYPVSSHDHYASIGVGYHMAKAIKDRLLPDAGLIYNSPAEVIANFGIYILWHVKKSIVGCDGNTLVLILQNGKFRWMTQEEVLEIENAIQMLYPSQRELLSALFNPAIDRQGIVEVGNSFVDHVMIIKDKLDQTNRMRKHMQELFDRREEARKAAQQEAEQPKPSDSQKSKDRQ